MERIKAHMSMQDAIDAFGIPERYLYVCDGERPCGRPCCLDHSRADVCHHTEDESHALYPVHDMTSFERHPAVRGGEAAVICVEPFRG